MAKERVQSRRLTAAEVVPTGWLARQLRAQADGLAGNLDLMWRDVRDSRWIGGGAEGWERVPYWLDGFIELARLLDDADMQRRAKRYIDSIIERQKPDGWLCPCEDSERARYDAWASFLILKVLVVWYETTGDGRIEGVVTRAFECLHRHIEANPLFDWGASRWYECLIPIIWLHRRNGDPRLRELALLLESQGMDYERLYRERTFDRPAEARYWNQELHVVNTAMMLKSRALMSYFTDEDPSAFAQSAHERLMRYHSMASGHFAGDECLCGDLPTSGSELCSVVEAMFSYEKLIEITGEVKWCDLLERTAFNALPATTSADMWTHQYLQMTNQPQCTRIPEAEVHFSSNNGEAHLFGLEPQYGCCTANFGQGWPKLALTVLSAYDGGISLNIFAPVRATVPVGDARVSVEVETGYPFRDTVKLTLRCDAPVSFALRIRIPAYAEAVTVNAHTAKTGEYYTLPVELENYAEIDIRLTLRAHLTARPRGLYCVDRGALLYSLRLPAERTMREYTADGVERKFPYCDYELRPAAPWAYGFAGDTFEPVFGEFPSLPFDSEGSPIALKARLAPVEWGSKNGICDATPASSAPCGDECEAMLYPFGCTDLRMTELPLIH